MLIGLRSADLLYSAIGRQTVSFANRRKYTEPLDICSTLFFGLVKDHAFSDGNKRTALLLLLYQLNLFGYLPNCSVREFEKLVVATAANELNTRYSHIWKKFDKMSDTEVKTISYWLKRKTKKKDHSYHLRITMRQMANALERYGVTYKIDNAKIHFERKIPARWFGKETIYRYSVPFGGWTRCVGASTARDILTNMNLYDQFSNYQDFIDGQDLYYDLIDEFEIPLRRLKDE